MPQVNLDFNARAATLQTEVDKVTGKLREVKVASKGLQQDMIATSATVRLLEGNLGTNTRAVARWIATVAGAGPVLKALFPLVGAIAFAGAVEMVAVKVVKFVRDVEGLPKRLNAAFMGAAQGAFVSVNELRVEGDKLDNTIARLEGRHQNYLKLELDEAAEAAGRLGDKIGKDSEKITEFLEKNKPGIWEKFAYILESGPEGRIPGLPATAPGPKAPPYRQWFGDKQQPGEYQTELSKRRLAMEEDISIAQSANDLALERQARERGINSQINLQRQYLDKINAAYKDASDNDKKRLDTLKTTIAADIQKEAIEERNIERREKVTELEIKHANERPERPYDKAIAELLTTAGEARAKMETVGMPAGVRDYTEALAVAQKKIAEVEEQEKRYFRPLSANQKAVITDLTVWRAQLTETAKAYEALYDITKKSENEAAAAGMMAAAHAQGYAAERAAAIEAQVMAKMGPHYTEDSKKADIEREQERYNATIVFDAKHTEAQSEILKKLREELTVTQALTAAQAGGAAATRKTQEEAIRREAAAAGLKPAVVSAQVA